jgi:hypothetical protein
MQLEMILLVIISFIIIKPVFPDSSVNIPAELKVLSVITVSASIPFQD